MSDTSSRREFLSIMAGSAGMLAGCRLLQFQEGESLPESVSLPTQRVEAHVRLLNRATFGPRPGDIGRVDALGRKDYVDALLRADGSESLGLISRLHRIDVLRMDGSELMDLPREEIIRQLQQAALLRATFGRNQLLERLVEFWSNHFNIYARKSEGMYLLPADTERVIRSNALGRFGDLLAASAKSPAMLLYLDNQVNRKGVPNENYARELLELHTMGVDGGYSQTDVQEVARCLTGWTIESRFLRPRGKFRFDSSMHDEGEKLVLGTRIPPGGGISDGERVLRILASHPSTASFISRKLCRYFLGHEPPEWVEQTKATYLRTNGDLRAMLRPILLADALTEAPAIVKRPFDFVVSSLRALDAVTDASLPLQSYLTSMGQPLYQWPMPDGYPDATASWTGSLLSRWKFATDLVGDRISGTTVSLKRLKERGADWSELIAKPNSPLKLGVDDERVALLLCSPEFQWR